MIWAALAVASLGSIVLLRWQKGILTRPSVGPSVDPTAQIFLALVAWLAFGFSRSRCLPGLGADPSLQQRLAWAGCLLVLSAAPAVLLRPVFQPRIRQRAGAGALVWLAAGPWLAALGYVIAHLTGSVDARPVQAGLREWLSADTTTRITMGILLVTLIPLVEEGIFRGLIQPGLQGLFQGVLPKQRGEWASIRATALAFGAVHNVEVFAQVFVSGLILGWLAMRTGGYVASVAFHACQNAATLAWTSLSGAGAS